MTPRIFPTLLLVLAITLLMTLPACSITPEQRTAGASHADLSAATSPAVAAEFVTHRSGQNIEDESNPLHESHSPDEETIIWRFWRDNRKIDIERPRLALGESWVLDGRNLIHHKLYHADRKAIEFQQDDLTMLQQTPSWQKLSLLFDPSLLQQLQAGEIDWSAGYPKQAYQGTLNGMSWHIVMRLDQALPLLIERQQAGFSERTELHGSYPLKAAPWQPAATDNYEIIDYADLGDRESDPFVIKVQAQMGHQHAH